MSLKRLSLQFCTIFYFRDCELAFHLRMLLYMIFFIFAGEATRGGLCLRNLLVRSWRNGHLQKSKAIDICR